MCPEYRGELSERVYQRVAEGVNVLDQFPSQLRNIRLSKGMTIEELSEETGIAIRTIKQLEGKQGANPKLATLKRLLSYLKVSLEELYPE